MWGIAFSLDITAWRLGKCDAVDQDENGKDIIVGVWYCFGPIAICYDYE